MKILGTVRPNIVRIFTLKKPVKVIVSSARVLLNKVVNIGTHMEYVTLGREMAPVVKATNVDIAIRSTCLQQ